MVKYFSKNRKWIVSTIIVLAGVLGFFSDVSIVDWKFALVANILLIAAYLYLRIRINRKKHFLLGNVRITQSKVKKIRNPIILLFTFFSIMGCYNLFFNQSPEVICNPETDIGCTLDFGVAGILASSGLACADNGESVGDFSIVSISSGNLKHNYLTSFTSKTLHKIAISKIGFPLTNKVKHKNTQWMHLGTISIEIPMEENFLHLPYRLWKEGDKLAFAGEIKDFKSGKVIGWFNENEFGVIETCNYSWNKDENGIEIIDNYNNVCFSVNIIPYENGAKELEFRGYFKEGDYYYIYNNTFTKTKDFAKAEKQISRIKRNFVHKGTGSLGKRKASLF